LKKEIFPTSFRVSFVGKKEPGATPALILKLNFLISEKTINVKKKEFMIDYLKINCNIVLLSNIILKL